MSILALYLSLFYCRLLTNGSDADYYLRDRGQIEVKGKGTMNTYFLIGKGSSTIPEPDDSLNLLPIFKSKLSISHTSQIKIIDTNQNNKQIKSKSAKSSTCLILWIYFYLLKLYLYILVWFLKFIQNSSIYLAQAILMDLNECSTLFSNGFLNSK